jgi:hypothetical protein
VAVLLHWFASVAKDSKGNMFGTFHPSSGHPPLISTHPSCNFNFNFNYFNTGSICFAGQGGEPLEQCISALSTSICGYTKISEFDMLEYSTVDSAKSLLSDLKVHIVCKEGGERREKRKFN